MSLLNIITQLIKEKGYTIAKIEKELDFGNGAIRRWDTSSPSCDKLVKLADFLNVSVDYLLGRTNIKHIRTDMDSKLINAYHEKKEMQSAVNTLLGIAVSEEPVNKSVPFTGRLVAKGGTNLGDIDEDNEPRHT